MDLQERRALVIGEGEAAERKAEALGRCGAEVTQAASFSPDLLEGCAIAIGAEASEDDLKALVAAATQRGIPVNVVDRPALCSFITPAVVDRSPITVAVSSGGAAPVLARLIRARIEALVPPAFGRLAAIADEFKTEIRRHLPDTALRRRVLERALAGRVADLVSSISTPIQDTQAESTLVEWSGLVPDIHEIACLVLWYCTQQAVGLSESLQIASFLVPLLSV